MSLAKRTNQLYSTNLPSTILSVKLIIYQMQANQWPERAKKQTYKRFKNHQMNVLYIGKESAVERTPNCRQRGRAGKDFVLTTSIA